MVDPLASGAVEQHLDATVRTWLGIALDATIDTPRLPPRLVRRLLRLEELESPHRDRWGMWEFSFCEDFRAGRLCVPEIDVWIADQRRSLAQRTSLEPPWPDERPFAVCLTHDVDLVSPQFTPRQVLRYMRAGLAGPLTSGRDAALRPARPIVRASRALWQGISSAPPTRETLERCVESERRRGVVGSYFFTVLPRGRSSRYDCVYDPNDACTYRDSPRRVADVMRSLADEGFDVGLHASYNSALDGGMLARERLALEEATGLSITTVRQHFLHWEARVTPRLQEGAALRADSSVGFNRSIGFRAGTSLPFRHFDLEAQRRLDLLELPLIIQDSALLGRYGLELDLALAKKSVAEILDAVAEVSGVATLLFHPNNLEQPDYLFLYEWSIEQALERNAWVTSLKRIETWWREREARLGCA